MIGIALDFICSQVNTYLAVKLGLNPGENAIMLFNVSQLAEANGNGNESASSAYLTMVNIEEDRISKSQENSVHRKDLLVYKNPKFYLNLYLLFSVNIPDDYKEALKRLSLIIQFFQYRNVFDSTNSPTLDPKIEKLIADMYTLGFEQANNLWVILGGKYLPSVLYKIRLVVIEDEAIDFEGAFIKSIAINENTN